jgi:hypothetical protein
MLPGAPNFTEKTMERPEAIAAIRDRANQLSAHITAIHPLVPKLADAPTQNELLKALFELTKQVEVVKKHLLKLEKRDETTDL